MSNYLYSLWLHSGDNVVRYATATSKEYLEKFVKTNCKEKYDFYRITPNYDCTELEESCIYDVYIDNKHSSSEEDIDKIVSKFRKWSEEELKRIYIQKIVTYRVELLR